MARSMFETFGSKLLFLNGTNALFNPLSNFKGPKSKLIFLRSFEIFLSDLRFLCGTLKLPSPSKSSISKRVLCFLPGLSLP
tara:strand:- start:212 stop:454 length:243 start_codon:yes stop_codon:yes gene_type:complete